MNKSSETPGPPLISIVDKEMKDITPYLEIMAQKICFVYEH